MTERRQRRAEVFARDGGRCAACGLDTEMVRKAWLAASREFQHAEELLLHLDGHYFLWNVWYGMIARLDALGFAPHLAWWNDDHEVPLWEGGSNDLPNHQTLCPRCHRDKSAVEAARRGRERPKRKPKYPRWPQGRRMQSRGF